MIIRSQEMETQKKENLRGGEGSVLMTILQTPEKMAYATLFNLVTIEQGSGIGIHEHLHETEYYLVISGSGIITDDEKEVLVNPGDLIVTGHGHTHGIRNEASEPLRFMALIIPDEA